ncbi:hypothetical protein QM012_000101 [Aureobasidium pullulans]|uniref:Peptidase A1 domain-containing protein n=1 Tax=Aureobasidium pullulans TaxID=5580 RepID=A0ABR0TUV7_AURPU
MLSILTLGLLAKACQASDFWVSKWSETPVGPDGPWHALNISWDTDPLQTFPMLPSLTKTSLLIAADACSRQDSACPNQVESGSWPMWTSSRAHADFLYMDGPVFGGSTWDDTVSWPLNLTNDVQPIHERTIVWDTNNNSNSLNNQAITLTHNLTVNSPGGQLYTMNAGFFSLYGAETNLTWLNTTGFNITQDLQLATAKQNSIISSLSYGLQIGSPSLDIEPSLVMGGYDRSRCLTEPTTSQNTTFKLVDISVGANGADWPFTSAYTANSNATTNFQGGLLDHDEPLDVLANPGVPYLHLPQATCDAIAKYIPVTYNQNLGLYLWNTESDARHYNEIIQTFAYLTFTFSDGSTQKEKEINVPFSLLNLELDTPLTASKTRYFPCRPFVPREGQPYHLGRAFLQGALLVQNWETNTTWLSQAPGPNVTTPSTPVIIEETDTTISQMPYAPDWLATWNGTLRNSDWTQSTGSNSSAPVTLSESSSLSGGTIAGIVVGAVAGLAIISAAIFFFIRRRRSKAGYGDVALISFDEDKSGHNQVTSYEHKGDIEGLATPRYEADSAHVNELPSNDADKLKIGELPLNMAKVNRAEVDGTGIAELPGHDVQGR